MLDAISFFATLIMKLSRGLILIMGLSTSVPRTPHPEG